MATYGDQIHCNAFAENDLSSNRYCFVELSGEYQVDINDATTDAVFGVLQNKPQANEEADVVVFGITKCRAGGTITAGQRISATASANATAAGSTSGVPIVGEAITSCTSGQLFTLMFRGGGVFLDT